VTELPPLNRISSRDSQGLVTKTRVRAKDVIKEAQENKVGVEKGENLDWDLHLLLAGLTKRRCERFTTVGDWKGR
jgi:hypothetical protein